MDDLIPVSTYFEISFGLIISMVLFIIDRRGKARQEEALIRQDDSLDIILDQVSKVNIFQTKTLSLAIESLGRDLFDLKFEIERLNKRLTDNTSGNPNESGPKTSEFDDVSEDPEVPVDQPFHSNKFSDILASQVNTFVSQIKNGLSDLGELDNKNDKEIYKTKKSLEFDVKDLINIESLISELTQNKKNKPKELQLKKDKGHLLEFQKIKSNFDDTIKAIPNILKNIEPYKHESESQHSEKVNDVKNLTKSDFDELNLQLDYKKSISDLVSFTENVLNLVDISKQDLENVRNKKPKKKNRKRIHPTKSFSSKNEHNQKLET